MRCCASRTTSIAADVAPSPAREAAAQFEAVLFAQAFAPLGKPLGFYGDLVVAEAARALARCEHGGLGARLERLFASAP